MLRCKLGSWYSYPDPQKAILCLLRTFIGWGSTTALLYGGINVGNTVAAVGFPSVLFVLNVVLLALKVMRLLAIASLEKWLATAERPLIVTGVRTQM